MNKQTGKWAGLLALGCLLLASVVNGQKSRVKPESYSGVAMGTGGVTGGRAMPFDFRISRYTTDEEVQKFAELVKEKGPDALRRALEKEDVGQINVTGRVGNQIAVARKRQVGPDTVITLATARNLPFVELYHSGRSVDYPFGFVQVRLNAKGEGSGQIIAAAKIRFNKKAGKYEIESFGNQYVKAVNVRSWK